MGQELRKSWEFGALRAWMGSTSFSVPLAFSHYSAAQMDFFSRISCMIFHGHCILCIVSGTLGISLLGTSDPQISV